ncbi:YihA family ribosome biogenesis GTP-binding protein [Erysipelothrix sp. HDW6C]|uniref:ribosome biogenesis GTP-binding protein YihA/YsxC n=1 Tax=Erysipelothrix sp. HDW6C TaxID=2714930 RepID=UPI00140D9F82|nr:ribosome biogenesis GTP-binding protein YihA/YsxC [Erysipelothrix sp. HDW6C]QIK69894.1 YihA family ribosome biogenesis GTP-binding protein [Erysipelothrix sp. HDW6C]
MNLNAQEAHLIISCASSTQFPETGQKEIVMVGKSNVGKSSLINAITNRKRLAYVGQRPGKTRLINFYHINDDVILTDVPGYGFANRSKQEQIHYGKLMDSYFELRHPEMMLILVDVRRGIGKDDIMMLEFAQHFGLAHAIVLTKTDKLSRNKIANIKREVFKDHVDTTILEFSSLDYDTREPIIAFIEKNIN